MGLSGILIDTSILIDYLRKKNKNNSTFYKIVDKYKLYISSITVFELYAGAIDKNKSKDIENVLKFVEIIHFDKDIAKSAGKHYISLKRINNIIEIRDLFIASTAISMNLPLMTFNIKHFSKINELDFINTDEYN